jgi:hypothetical protein
MPILVRAVFLACLVLRTSALEVPDAVVAIPTGSADGETWGGSAVVIARADRP